MSDPAPFSKVNVALICLSVVLVIAMIVGGIVHSVRQGTERRETCVENGGSFVAGYCISPDGAISEP